MTERLSEDLLALLGEDKFVALVEAFGGTRLYVPVSPESPHPIAEAIGPEKARLLARRYSPAVLRIPLARELRAAHYRAKGLSNAQIVRKLGITETGVEKIFARMERPPAKGSSLPLFDF